MKDNAKQLKQIEETLDKAHVPREVFIGTDSTADRVEWMAIRLGNFERNAKTRRNQLCDLVEPLLLAAKHEANREPSEADAQCRKAIEVARALEEELALLLRLREAGL